MGHLFSSTNFALTTTETDARQRRIILALCLGLAAVSIALLPFASQPGPEVPQIVPFYVAVILLTDMITGFLLLVQFREDRSWSLLLLACGYLFTASMAIPHLLTFPGGLFGKDPVIGGPQTSVWIWLLWHLCYPACALAAVVVAVRPRPVAAPWICPMIGVACGTVVAAVVGLTLLTTLGHDLLPPVVGPGVTLLTRTYVFGGVGVGLAVAAITVIWVFLHGRQVLYLWLTLALTAFIFDIVLNFAGLRRYSFGWYLGRANGMISASFLLLLLLGEITSLYRRLGHALRSLTVVNRTLEQRVAKRTQELEVANRNLRNALETTDNALREKNLLLREVYHRVKNNLQVVDSLLLLQASRLPDTAGEALMDLRPRVNALGLVHQQLMQSADLATFSITAFLDDLCRSLGVSFGVEDRGIILRMDAEPVPVDLDLAIPLGLLITELVSNAIKHAFPSGQGGEILVRFQLSSPGRARITVADTGRGMPENIPDNTMGRQIIEALLLQMEAEMQVINSNGTTVDVSLPFGEGYNDDSR
jgi:two-component sensor histidine kinase